MVPFFPATRNFREWGVPHLLALLWQLVLAGDDLHGIVAIFVRIVLNQRHRAVRPNLQHTCQK